MATRRRVTTSRVSYTQRPSGPPRGRGMELSGGTLKIGLWLGVGIVIVVSLWRGFAITSIQVEGNNMVPKAEILKAANVSLAHHPFSRHQFTLGLAPLVSDLETDQRIGDVQIVRKWPNQIVLSITERQLRLGWRSGASVYLLDGSGVAVSQVTEATTLPVVTDSTSLPVTIGKQIVPQQFVTFIGALVGELPSQTGLAIVDMSVPDTTSEVYVKTKAGYTIKFDTTSGVEDQLRNLKLVLSTLVKLKKVPSQYIDLRVPNKAYYL